MGNGGCSHTCTNTAGSFSCGCPPGFSLDAQGRSCADVDECSRGNANCSHFCVNTEGSYRCGCPTGLRLAASGRDCERARPCPRGWEEVLDLDQNLDQNLDQDQEMAQDGGEPGCRDVNECAGDHGCQQICINSPGSYRCECFDGYLLLGKRCVGKYHSRDHHALSLKSAVSQAMVSFIVIQDHQPRWFHPLPLYLWTPRRRPPQRLLSLPPCPRPFSQPSLPRPSLPRHLLLTRPPQNQYPPRECPRTRLTCAMKPMLVPLPPPLPSPGPRLSK